MKKSLFASALVLMFAVSLPLHAQDGCVNSPEAPTALLAVAGSVGAFVAMARNRFRARKSK